MKWWRTTEERLEADEEVEAYKRQVQISPLAIFVPDLYERIFNPEYIPEEVLNDPLNNGMFVPHSDEDFDAMFDAWSEDALDLSGVFQTPDLDLDGTMPSPGLWEPPSAS